MAKQSRLTTGLSGVAGEYFVAAELSRRGYIASLTLKNTRGIDILVSNSNTDKAVAIQVKTHQGVAKQWVLSDKHEKQAFKNMYFIFVRLCGFELPQFHIVPAKDVISYTSSSHKRWLSELGKKGRLRRDSSVRKFFDEDDKYLGRWDLLKL